MLDVLREETEWIPFRRYQ